MDTAKILIRVILGLNQTKSGHTAFSTVYSGKKLGADFFAGGWIFAFSFHISRFIPR